MNDDIGAMFHRLLPTACATLLGLHCALASGTALAASLAKQPMAAPPAGHYQIDKAHASLLLRVSHLGFSTYTTRFSRFDSDLTFDPKNIPASKVVTTIDASSFEMDAAPQFCLDIVRGTKFLDVAKYPKIVFTSGKVRMTGAKSFEIDGTLDLRGVTRPLVLKGTYNGGYAGMAGMDPHARVGFSAHGVIKRSDFGMKDDLPAPGTTMGVGDMIDVSIESEFTGPPLPQSADEKH